NEIADPYNVPPRRVWDLKFNRVIPYHLAQAVSPNGKVDYVAISHSWVAGTELVGVQTPINGFAWPVPIPRELDLEIIRNEVLGNFPTARYCWLDALCLRQKRALDDDSLRNEELRIDVPTIGNIYIDVHVLRYYNGLGRQLANLAWDAPTHWLNRAWTLQESRPGGIKSVVAGGLPAGFSSSDYLTRIKGTKNGTTVSLGAAVKVLEDVVALLGGGVFALAKEMESRASSNRTDKIAGLSYLLELPKLPAYDWTEEIELSWIRCLKAMHPGMRKEIFFTSPTISLRGTQEEQVSFWYPSWEHI
ncbi:hypothetical protein BDZ91DRAFT_644906, partial [Kalaharituber pfeilii]